MTSPTNPNAGQEPEWQAIETAPVDGTIIMGHWADFGTQTPHEADEAVKNHGDNRGWFRNDRNVWSWVRRPTHWRPITAPLDGSGKGTPEIINPEGLKGGPGAQAKLREYHGKFRALGDNPPMVVAENGEAILSMMWPVHEQTPEGEKAAVEYTSAFATKIAELLNTDLATLLTRAETAEREREELVQDVCGECNGDGWCENAVEGRYPCVCMTEREPYQLLQQEIISLRAKLEAAEAELKEAQAVNKTLGDAIERIAFRFHLVGTAEEIAKQVCELPI